MNTPVRLGLFAVGLAAVFGVALGAGQLTGPVGAAEKQGAAHRAMSDGSRHTGHGMADESVPGGLLVSDRGYTLTAVPAAPGEFAFRIVGPHGRAATAFDAEHGKRMHLIVVRRDLSGFRHVHPVMGADGTWRVASPMSGPDTYRVFADFKPAGADPLTLGIDSIVPGDVTPRRLPAPATTASVDGYTVALRGALSPGKMSRLDLTVARDGKPVTDLRPYLGA